MEAAARNQCSEAEYDSAAKLNMTLAIIPRSAAR
jgi:hypothetical protein